MLSIWFVKLKCLGAVRLQGRILLRTSDESLDMNISVLEALV